MERKKDKRQRRYEDLTFTDDFMFCKVLQNNESLCKELTELILGREIGGIVRIDRQLPIEITAEGRGVRFDVYMEDDQDSVYDIEMQTGDPDNLPQRSRYYQGMMDLQMMERGYRFEELKNSYIIFICMKNPFPHAGRHRYSFRTLCSEDPALELGDRAEKILITPEGSENDVSDELASFLKYTVGNQAETDFTRRLEEKVQEARLHEKWRIEYMTLLERDEKMREEGRIEGRIEGRKEGHREGLQEGIKEGTVSTLANLVEDGLLSAMEAADRAGMSEAEFKRML